MKKTFFSVAALLLTFSIVGCEPPAAAPSTSTEMTTPAVTPADSNVTDTAETPAVTETPAG